MDAKLLEKLRKVMVLAKEGVEGEAQAAAAILQKMLTEHNLSIADLEKKGAHAPTATEKGHDLGKAAFRWKLDLAEAVAEHYWCVALVDNHRKTVSFVGRPDNVESLIMIYAWLIDQVKRIANEERRKHHETTGEHVDPLRWQVNFGVGAIKRLAVRLKEERARHAAEVARNSMGDVVALTLSRVSENSDYLEQRYGYRTDGRETRHQREWREKREAEQRQKDEWRVRDPEGYFRRYPEETEEAKAQKKLEDEEWWAYWRKKEARNARRRASYEPRYRESRYDPEAERKDEQAYRARRAGESAADRINLQPFLGGDVPADASRQVKGRKS